MAREANTTDTDSSFIAGVRRSFRALRHRNYRLFFFGQGVSLVGTWMQRIAMGWLVYRVTDSELLLGLVGFVSVAPALLFGPIAGVVADRYPLRSLIVVTQIVAMLQAAALAVLAGSPTVGFWRLAILSMVLGLVNVFDVPARQSFVVQMLGNRREDLTNAIALNSLVFNCARMLGPTVAGILLALLGEAACFWMNAVSYFAVIVALLAMHGLPARTGGRPRKMLEDMREGLRYFFGSPPMRALVLLVGLVNLVGMPYAVLMPVFAKDILRGGPETMGYLMASAGVGALIGAALLTQRRTVVGLERVVGLAPLGLSVALIGFGLSQRLALSMAALVGIGFCMMTQMASTNTLLQTIVDDDKRGRVMGFYAMSFMLTAPIGSLLAGVSADRIGAPWTLTLCGILVAIVALAIRGELAGLAPLVQARAVADAA